MKIICLSAVMLFFIIISGCEYSDSSNTSKEPQQTAIKQEQIKTEPKKQTSLHKQAKKVVKTKPVKVKTRPTYQTKPSQPENTESPELTEEDQNQQPLDLSLPLKIQNTQIATNEKETDKNAYLPDLFSKKNNKNQSLQIQGNLIKREEEAVEKDRIVDGAEIKIKLLK